MNKETRIQDVIDRLTYIKEKVGNLPVIHQDDDGYDQYINVSTINVYNDSFAQFDYHGNVVLKGESSEAKHEDIKSLSENYKNDTTGHSDYLFTGEN